MPWEVKKTPSCPVSKPYGVFKKGTGELGGRCHVSRAKALAQMRALYASESGKMNSEQAVVNLVKSFNDEWLDGNKKWVKVYPFSSWTHPLFSDTFIDEETARALKESFDGKFYGEQDYVVSYDHGLDPAKGGKAAGWYEQVEVRNDGLWGLIRFTETARDEIDNGEWRYFSGEHYDEWENPHTGEIHSLVFSGGALTNKPYVKEGMVPLNFSDVYTEKEHADWSTAYKNNLPDSAFLYIEPGGKKDSEGKTTPRSLRHFPVRDSNGKVDQAHVRNALARIPQSNVSASAKASSIAKARKLLNKSSSEVDMPDDVVDEHVPNEHADPGETQDPPLEGANVDDSEGSRLDTPPFIPKGDDQVDAQLRDALGLDPDADIIKAVKDIMVEVAPLRAAAKAHSERKSFAELYPKEFAELEEGRRERRDTKAKAFSEQFRKLHDADGKPTGKGFPAVVINKLEEVHKKFSDGSASVVDFTEVVELIGKTGMVDFNESGSSRTDTYMDDITPRTAGKAFADKVMEIQEQDQVDFRTATSITAERFPDLFEAYQASLPGRSR